jgi:hypothetical protein
MARPRRRTGATGEELEAAFAVKVENLLTLYGWRWYHTHDSRRSPAGFPDYVAVRGPELIFVELKAERGRVRPQQREWLEDLIVVGHAVALELDELRSNAPPNTQAADPPAVDVYLWRPSELDAINDRLSRGRHRLDPVG